MTRAKLLLAPASLCIAALTACDSVDVSVNAVGALPQSGFSLQAEKLSVTLHSLPVSASYFADEVAATASFTEPVIIEEVEEQPVTSSGAASHASGLSAIPADAERILISTVEEWHALPSLISASNADFISIAVEAGSYNVSPISFDPGGRTVQILGYQAQFNGGGPGYWLDAIGYSGGRVELSGVTVSGFSNGLRISGQYQFQNVAEAYGAGLQMSGVIADTTFTRIGEAFTGRPGYAAIHLQNTSGVLVAGSVFNEIRNSSGPAKIHAVYAVLSNNISITNNEFVSVSGDPIRIRNSCSGISVTGNSFVDAGSYAHVSDWFCGVSCASSHGQGVEYPSSMPFISGNSHGSGYTGYVPAWAVTS